jgi:hypothetical protein
MNKEKFLNDLHECINGYWDSFPPEIQNDQYLEYKYEEGLDMGMSEEEAANYARECLEQDSAPLYEDHSET